MGLASALTTALTGMQGAETQIDVVGNNLANSQTVGFKESEAIFASQFLQTQSLGSPPAENNGGTNPRQIGLGMRVAEIRPDFTQGTISISSTPSDLAIQGNGFFIVEGSDAERLYTRNGIFKTNADNELINATGERVLGFGVNDDFEIQETSLVPLTIPLGTAMVARPTENVVMQGVLTPAGDEGDTAGVVQTVALARAGGGPLTAATLLTDVVDTSLGPTPLFDVGELEFTPRKGDRDVATRTMTITATSTVQDLMTFMQQAIGIQTTAEDPLMPTSVNNIPTETLPLSPGIVLQNGQIRIVSNNGTGNSVDVDSAAFRLTTTTGNAAVAQPGLQLDPGRRWRKRRRRLPGLRLAGNRDQRAGHGGAGIAQRQPDRLSLVCRFRRQQPHHRRGHRGGHRPDHVRRRGQTGFDEQQHRVGRAAQQSVV